MATKATARPTKPRASKTRKPGAKKRYIRPIYFVIEEVALLSPGRRGEIVGALVPLTNVDRNIMRARKYHKGQEIRADMKKPRNYKFFALAHGIGQIMIDNLEEFEKFGEDAHAAFKELQTMTGVECDLVKYELGDGTEIYRTEPRSIAFDEMEEGAFSLLVDAAYKLIQRKFWDRLTEDAKANFVEMMEKQR